MNLHNLLLMLLFEFGGLFWFDCWLLVELLAVVGVWSTIYLVLSVSLMLLRNSGGDSSYSTVPSRANLLIVVRN